MPHSHIIRLILYYTIPHTQLILYLISHPSHPIPSSSYTSRQHPSHLKLKTDVIGEQGLAALALGKFEEVYEIEEAHEIEEHYKIEDEVKGERGARFARMGEI